MDGSFLRGQIPVGSHGSMPISKHQLRARFLHITKSCSKLIIPTPRSMYMYRNGKAPLVCSYLRVTGFSSLTAASLSLALFWGQIRISTVLRAFQTTGALQDAYCGITSSFPLWQGALVEGKISKNLVMGRKWVILKAPIYRTKREHAIIRLTAPSETGQSSKVEVNQIQVLVNFTAVFIGKHPRRLHCSS